VPIVPRGPRRVVRGFETRQLEWFPLPHPIVEEGGTMCVGADDAIQDHAPDHPVLAPTHTFRKD
jgi:hypothetical protein